MLVALRLFLGGGRAIRLPVVLVVVDRFACIVLLMIYLLPFLRCHPAAVGLPVVVHLLIDVPCALLQALGLLGSQVPVLRAVGASLPPIPSAPLALPFRRSGMLTLLHRG